MKNFKYRFRFKINEELKGAPKHNIQKKREAKAIRK
jgi:hypothetical protein